jgi:enamine deaminase RidA (YjgF/YER057c/UK114 family)
MTLECINPKDLPTPQTYSQVVIATGSKLVFISGQEPEDINGVLVGQGDLARRRARCLAISPTRSLRPVHDLSRSLGLQSTS